MSRATDIARAILDGFDKHYRLFREISAGAKERFECADWAAVRDASRRRIQMYDRRVRECVQALRAQFPAAERDETLWPRIKLAYIGLLYDHRQPECAETFYNSVACRVLHRSYYHNDFIFWRPATATEHIEGDAPTYRCYYPRAGGLRRVLLQVVTGFGLANRFENLRRDVRCLQRALDQHFPVPWQFQPNFQVQVLSSLFYRNKAAYIIGRVVNGNTEQPFAIPVLPNERRELYTDTLLLEPEHLSTLFSFSRAYFMVDMEVPSAYVSFLRSVVPAKSGAELYTMLGLQKHGKTLFYRDLHHHLKHSSDNFVVAPGIKGMVMLVFTLPSLPFVFKVIRDAFEPPKDLDRKTVQEKYLLVKYHDRVGRLADTLEYSNVAFPLNRIDRELLDELRSKCASSLELEGDELVIGHVYIERRMIPLNLYLQDADDARRRDAIHEYGNAIKDLAGANIFPGDMLTKNFGVTRYGRVVFYDYDEICYMTECNFRRIPPPRSWEDEMSSEPYYSVGPHDVFPEQFAQFLFADNRARALFDAYHGDLNGPAFWIEKQARIRAGVQEDVFPYPARIRFRNRFRELSRHPGRGRAFRAA